jgi:hypothetical protein
VPDGALAFQIGETAQVVSGGVLRATPHYVRGPSREHAGWRCVGVGGVDVSTYSVLNALGLG